MINLRKLAEQQKKQRAEKIKNKILKQALNYNLAELLSPKTDKLDELKEATQEVGNIIKKNNTPQLVLENTPTTHQPIEITPTTHQPKENIGGVIYDVEIEINLNKMTDNTGFFKIHHNLQRGWMINNYPIKMLRGTLVEISNKKYIISPRIRKVLADQSYDTAKSMTDKDNLIF